MSTQISKTKTMKSPDEDFILRCGRIFFETFFEFFRGLVRKGNGEGFLAGFKLTADARDAVSQCMRLARAGAGDDQQMSTGIIHGPLLRGVELWRFSVRVH